MTEQDALAYVKASAQLQGLPLDEDRVKAVAVHLLRSAHLASLLDNTPLSPEHELAEIYKSAAFPADGYGDVKP